MSISYTLFIQVAIMFILIFVGFILRKLNKLSKEWVKQSTTVLLYVVTPCVLIKAYQVEYTPLLLKKLFSAAILTIVFHLVSILIVSLVFRKEETLRYRVSIFGTIYSNCGFMAIPILSAVFGDEGVFFGSAYLAVFTVFYWTHGLCTCSGSIKSINVKSVILNPGVIGTLISIGLFLLSVKLPYVVYESVSYLASMNTPLAMLVIGTYLVDVDFKKAVKNVNLYLSSFLRLIVLPLICIGIAYLLKLDTTVAKTIIISSACPIAAVTSLFATKFDLDEVYATELVSFTTLLSIATIPLVMIVSDYILP